MQADIARWEHKYQRAGHVPKFIPEADLTLLAKWFTGHGHALDLASGVGQNALWLAGQGYKTTAIDGSQRALDYCKQEAKNRTLCVTTQAVDLDNHSLPENEFDVIVVVRYLNRSLFENIRNALKPNGLIFYKTFNQNHLMTKPDFNPDYVLKNGELSKIFEQWKILETNESSENESQQSRLLAQKRT
ncbi:MAG: class I SAM-dependent methyltransferase [Arenicellales bacterium WSBS_2016_MAG_OTU3]